MVLIMGGTSGVGMVGIQIAKLYNCTVIATAGNKEKMDKCIEIGADYVVNHRETDWFKKVRDITKKTGVDVIFEHIGKADLSTRSCSFEDSRHSCFNRCYDRL